MSDIIPISFYEILKVFDSVITTHWGYMASSRIIISQFIIVKTDIMHVCC